MLERKLEEDQRIPPRPLKVRILRGIIAAIAVLGLVYLSGIHQFFFLQKTPDTIEQPVLASKTDAQEMTVPVTVHILTGDTGSSRTEEDAKRLIANSNNIWTQANIEFRIHKVKYIKVTQDDLRTFNRTPHQYIEESNSYDPSTANVYFIRTLSGVNGLAYGGTNAVSVADYTSSLDFRTLAHEFGHLLGLPHVSSNTELMATGGRGTNLTKEENKTARDTAKKSFNTKLDE